MSLGKKKARFLRRILHVLTGEQEVFRNLLMSNSVAYLSKKCLTLLRSAYMLYSTYLVFLHRDWVMRWNEYLMTNSTWVDKGQNEGRSFFFYSTNNFQMPNAHPSGKIYCFYFLRKMRTPIHCTSLSAYIWTKFSCFYWPGQQALSCFPFFFRNMQILHWNILSLANATLLGTTVKYRLQANQVISLEIILYTGFVMFSKISG
jgi:hypothetical protein